MTKIYNVISSMRYLKTLLHSIFVSTGEASLKLLTIFLLIYVVLQTIELPLF